MNIALRVYSARWKVFEREWRERQLCRNVYSKLAKRAFTTVDWSSIKKEVIIWKTVNRAMEPEHAGQLI